MFADSCFVIRIHTRLGRHQSSCIRPRRLSELFITDDKQTMFTPRRKKNKTQLSCRHNYSLLRIYTRRSLNSSSGGHARARYHWPRTSVRNNSRPVVKNRRRRPTRRIFALSNRPVGLHGRPLYVYTASASDPPSERQARTQKIQISGVFIRNNIATHIIYLYRYYLLYYV